MDIIPYIPAALAVALFVALWRWKALPRPLPYTRRGSLLTQAEMRFYRVLAHAVPDGLIVCPKVRLMDGLLVDDGARREFGAPASGMRVDSVMAAVATPEPVLVIELGDRSHFAATALGRDAFQDAASAAAAVPVPRGMTGCGGGRGRVGVR
jgi:Protein of unknown function (DUF2726)